MRLRVLIILGLVVIGWCVVVWLRGNLIRSAAQVETDLRTKGGVVAAYAKVDRDSPPGRGLLSCNNTLELVRPRIVHSLEEAGGKGVIVIPDEPWVLNDLEAAVKIKAELDLPVDLDAILPSRMRLLTRGRRGEFHESHTGEVNYLCIRDSPSAGGEQ